MGFKRIPMLIAVALGLLIWFVIPVPEGVTENAWHLLALFVATIAAIIGKAMPIGALSIVAITLVAVSGVTGNEGAAKPAVTAPVAATAASAAGPAPVAGASAAAAKTATVASLPATAQAPAASASPAAPASAAAAKPVVKPEARKPSTPADLIRDALSAMSNSLIWLIGISIMISRGLIKTGLGARIGY